MKTTKTVEVQCSLERLWKVLTESEFTQQYMFNCSVSTTWLVEEEIIWQGNFNGYEAYQKGVVITFNPFEEIKYSTFDPNFGLEDKPENYIHVTYRLSKKNDSVELEISNETFDGNEERMNHIKSGWDMVLPLIKEVAEK